MNEVAQKGAEWLTELLALMGLAATVTVELSTEDGSYWLTIAHQSLSPAQQEHLIGEDGKTIDSIQYLANIILNLGLEREAQHPYTVELNGYRAERQAILAEAVARAIATVRETGQEVEMAALSSAERRQVHNLLKDEADLATESRGEEPNRRIYVRLR
jgi:spoIIIJ-associated protein